MVSYRSRTRRAGRMSSRYVRPGLLGKRSRAQMSSGPMRRRSTRSGVAGTTRYQSVKLGRDLPLYVPKLRQTASEMHYHDYPLLQWTPAKPGGILEQFNDIGLGTSITQRLGSRVTQLSLQMRGECKSTAANANYHAMIIVYDRMPTGVLPVITDIFDSDDVASFQRADTRDRFQFLHRRDFKTDGTTDETASHLINQRLAFRLQSSFATGATGGGMADIKTGALYFVLLTSSLISSATFQFAMRLGFQA